MALKRRPALLSMALLIGTAGAWWWESAISGSRITQARVAATSSGSAAEQPPIPAAAPLAAATEKNPPERPVCLGPAPAVPKAPAPPYELSGRLGLWVAEINPATLEVIGAVGTNPDSVFPLASTYKQAVFWAVLREFDAGRLSPTERLDITPSSQSLGEYPFDGTNIRTLTDRMIRRSDNTATDLLHRRVGLAKVQAVADDLGLCQTRLILPTKDWWVAEAGLSDSYLAHPDWWQRPDRNALAARIDADARGQQVSQLAPQLDHYFETVHQPRDDLGSHNLSTPYEFATLLAHEYLRSSLSPRAERWQHEVAALGHGKSSLRAGQLGHIQTFYGKGGNGWRLLTYTGYFQTKDGHHVVYAFMQHGADQWYTMPNTFHAFAWINAAVDEVIGPRKPLPQPTSQPPKPPA